MGDFRVSVTSQTPTQEYTFYFWLSVPALMWNQKLRDYDMGINRKSSNFNPSQLSKGETNVAIKYIEQREVSQESDFKQQLLKLRLPEEFEQVDSNETSVAH